MHIISRNIGLISAAILLAAFFTPQYSSASSDPNAGVEALVRASFPDVPDMIAIARCESGIRQFRADGSVLKGGAGGRYVGIFQIDENHAASAQSRALDINTVDGNIAYARHMFFASGTNPWKSCLASKPQPPPSAVTPVPIPAGQTQPSPGIAIKSNLGMGMVTAEVLTLQQILNKLGFVLATTGPGSPGNETTRFGPLTLAAVRKFQCARNIVCDGTEATTGYGRVGPKTRNALAQ